MDSFLTLSVTYGDLERALLKLGFSLTVAPPHRLYYNGAPESFFGFSLSIPLDQTVRPAHLSSARHAVVAMGVADEAVFRRLLTVPESDAEVSRPATGNGHVSRQSRSAKPHVPALPVEVH